MYATRRMHADTKEGQIRCLWGLRVPLLSAAIRSAVQCSALTQCAPP